MLKKVHIKFFIVRGFSCKNPNARKGKIKYERPKKINLVDHTDPKVSVKYVQEIK